MKYLIDIYFIKKINIILKLKKIKLYTLMIYLKICDLLKFQIGKIYYSINAICIC